MEGEMSDAEFQEEEKKWEKYFASKANRDEMEREDYEKYRKSMIENYEIPKREGQNRF